MIRYRKLITLEVVDKDSDKPIGKVFDAIYSKDYKKIEYLIVKNNNLIRNKAPIPYEDIKFSSENKVKYLKDMQEFKDSLLEDKKEYFNFIDKEIRTDNAEIVGFIKDIVINKEDGSIDGFVITEGVFEDLIKGRNYIPFFESTKINEDYIHISNEDFKSN